MRTKPGTRRVEPGADRRAAAPRWPVAVRTRTGRARSQTGLVRTQTGRMHMPARFAGARTAVAALLAGVAFAFAAGCQGEQSAAGGFTPPPTPVETAPVERKTVSDVFETVGSIEANESVVIVSEIRGVIRRLSFEEGHPVRQGQLLVQLDDTEISAQVDRATAVRDQSQSAYDRVRRVVDRGAGSAQDLDDAAAALKVAEAELAIMEAQKAKTRITAPFDGIVGPRRISPGSFVQAGEPMAEVSQVQIVKVDFSAPERFVPRIQPGAEVEVRSNAFPGETFRGIVDVIDPVLDPATRNVQILARVDNPELELRPGMSANVAVVMGRRTDSMTIPNEAVFAEGSQSFVYVVGADSTVSRTAITTGARLRETVEVISGLQPGDRVVRAGHQKLYPGARILPVDSRSGQDAGGGSEASPGTGGAGATDAGATDGSSTDAGSTDDAAGSSSTDAGTTDSSN